MSKIIVVYHSKTGRTKLIAEAIAKGAGGKIMSVENINWEELDSASAIIFGSPTYMGSVSAPLKAFIDETGSRWLSQKWKNKIAGGFTNASYSSGDKLNTLVQIMIFAMQHSMIWVGSDSMPDNEINRMGCFVGVMSQSQQKTTGIQALNDGDVKTAENYGKRIAEITAKFTN